MLNKSILIVDIAAKVGYLCELYLEHFIRVTEEAKL